MVDQIRCEPMVEGSDGNKKAVSCWSRHCCLWIGDKKMASEESKTKVEVISVSEKELPDDMSKEDFAARVMDAVHDGILGKIMKSAVTHSMDVVLRKEVTKLADEVLRYRKTLSEKMLADKSRTFKDPVCLEKLPDGFEAGWKEWKSGWDDREELAYQAFMKEIVQPPPE